MLVAIVTSLEQFQTIGYRIQNNAGYITVTVTASWTIVYGYINIDIPDWQQNILMNTC